MLIVASLLLFLFLFLKIYCSESDLIFIVCSFDLACVLVLILSFLWAAISLIRDRFFFSSEALSKWFGGSRSKSIKGVLSGFDSFCPCFARINLF
jgi:hypothetical protein